MRERPRTDTVDDLIDFTPELRAEAIEITKKYVTGPVFTPPSVAGPDRGDKLGTIQRVVWETDLGAGTTGTLMTYESKGRQYIVVAIGGQNHPGEFVAFALP